MKSRSTSVSSLFKNMLIYWQLLRNRSQCKTIVMIISQRHLDLNLAACTRPTLLVSDEHRCLKLWLFQNDITHQLNYAKLRCKYLERYVPRSQKLAYLWVGSHDGIIPIIIQGGGCGVERAGPIKFSLHLVVFTPFRDLLPVFEPIDLHSTKHTKSNKEGGHYNNFSIIRMFQRLTRALGL